MKSQKSLSLFTLLVATASLLSLSLTLTIAHNVDRLLSLWGEEMQITLYLDDNITAADQANLEAKLASYKEISYYELINQQRALDSLRTQMAGFVEDLAKDQDLMELIPLSYQVWIDTNIPVSVRVQRTKEIASDLKSIPGVTEASYGQEWLARYGSLVKAVQSVAMGMALIVFAATVLIFSNAIRAQVDSRRYEIEVLELIGATPAMIRKPFVVRGLAMGTIAATAAIGLNSLAVLSAKNALSRFPSFVNIAENLGYMPAIAAMGMLAIGLLVGFLGSYISVSKINNGWAAAQR